MRFGVWMPVYGGWLRAHGFETEPSVTDCLDLAVEAERLGYDHIYVSENFLNCIHREDHDVLDAWSLTAALATSTQRIKLATALKPAFRPPLVAAQMLSTVDRLAAGRLETALVCGWWRREFDNCGVAWRAHDDKYEDAAAYLEAMAKFWTAGRDAAAPRRPLARARRLPIWIAGHSERALRFAAERADVLFLNGMDPAGVNAMRVKLDALPGGQSVRLAMTAFVIIAQTDDAAEAERKDLVARAHSDRIRFYRAAQMEAGAVGWAGLGDEAFIDANGGLAAGLVGCPEQVVKRLDAFASAGLDEVVCQFADMLSGVEIFADAVMPAFSSSYHPCQEGAI